MFKRSMIFFAALCCLTLTGAAQSQKQPCANAQNQQELNRCAADEYKKTDAELNRVYQQLTPKLEPAHREKLKAAQRAWLSFRDAHCECSAFLFDGGTLQPLIRYTCLDQTSRERIKQLRALLAEVGK